MSSLKTLLASAASDINLIEDSIKKCLLVLETGEKEYDDFFCH